MDARKQTARAKMAAERPSRLGKRKITIGETQLHMGSRAAGAYTGSEDAADEALAEHAKENLSYNDHRLKRAFGFSTVRHRRMVGHLPNMVTMNTLFTVHRPIRRNRPSGPSTMECG